MGDRVEEETWGRRIINTKEPLKSHMETYHRSFLIIYI